VALYIVGIGIDSLTYQAFKKQTFFCASYYRERKWPKKDKLLPATQWIPGKSISRREKGLRNWYLLVSLNLLVYVFVRILLVWPLKSTCVFFFIYVIFCGKVRPGF